MTSERAQKGELIMTGEYKITHDHMKSLKPCADGWRDFLTAYPREEYPEGVAYQDILDRCADEGRMDYVGWLIHKIGPTTDVREYTEEIVDADKNIAVAGTIIFRKNATVKNIKAGLGIVADESIVADEFIEAGGRIVAGRSIVAGLGIVADESIEAGGRIEAGRSIVAGLGIVADESIVADEFIEAGGSIEADRSIVAGESIVAGGRIVAGESIKAKAKPKNIVRGEYQPTDNET